MSKLKLTMRDIGGVRIYDLEGEPTQETLQDIAWKIQKNIRRHRLQRVIINLQRLPTLEPLGARKIVAACIRPQRSLIFGASRNVAIHFESTYMPHNVRLCPSEKEVAEDLGPFLLERNLHQHFESDSQPENGDPAGQQMERRRSKRMHVALPLTLLLEFPGGERVETKAIATNISEHGLFAEYLDLETSARLDAFAELLGQQVLITVNASANFPEEYQLKGIIRRKDLRKNQLGLGIEFIP